MVIFPEDLIHAVNKEKKRMKRRKKSAGVRGGGGAVGVDVDVHVGAGVGVGAMNGQEEQRAAIEGGEFLTDCNGMRSRRKKKKHMNHHPGHRSTSRTISNRTGRGIHHSIWSNGVIGLYQSFVRWVCCLF